MDIQNSRNYAKQWLDGRELAAFLHDFIEAVSAAQEVSDIGDCFPYVDTSVLLEMCVERLRLGDELYWAGKFKDEQPDRFRGAMKAVGPAGE